LKFDEEARSSLLKGINLMAAAVKATLGPKAATSSSIEVRQPTNHQGRRPVAKEIELKDPTRTMGAQMLKEVASKTSYVAATEDDATVLAQAISVEGLRNVTAAATRWGSSAASRPPWAP